MNLFCDTWCTYVLYMCDTTTSTLHDFQKDCVIMHVSQGRLQMKSGQAMAQKLDPLRWPCVYKSHSTSLALLLKLTTLGLTWISVWIILFQMFLVFVASENNYKYCMIRSWMVICSQPFSSRNVGTSRNTSVLCFSGG